MHVVYNGIDLEPLEAPYDDADTRARARHRSRPPVGRLRRPHHAAEGAAVPAARRARCCRPRCSSCSAPARPTPPRSWPRSRAGVDALQRRARRRRLDRPAAQPARALRGAHGGDRLRLPVGLRAARHREPRGHGVRRCRSSARRRAASPRSSTTASPGGSCRSTRPRTARARRSTPTASSPISPRPSPRSSATPSAPRAMGRGGPASAPRRTSAGTRSRRAPREIYARRCSLSVDARGSCR